MVRKCHVLTMACMTVLACGGIASAETKAPFALRDAVKSFDSAAAATMSGNAVGSCADIWFNGPFDGQNGQASHRGGAFRDGTQVADDFYLCEGYVYDLTSISGTLITNSIPAINKALVDVYSDCDGMPAELLFTLKDGTFTVVGPYAMDTSFRVVDWTFTVANQVDAKLRSIVLKGGTYWVSLQGLTDGQCPTMQMCDSSYWGTTNMVKGSVPKKRDGTPTGVLNQYNFTGPWTPIDECCIGCTDLAFSVAAVPCKILVDNGIADRTALPAGSKSQWAPNDVSRDNRTADDFVTPPCDPFRICYIEGCIYSNCDFTRPGVVGVFEIYGNDCKYPAYCFGGATLGNGTDTRVVDLGFSTVFEGKTLRAYRVEFHKLNITLAGGKQYWISIGVRSNYDINQKTLFCYNFDCDRNCLIRWNPGHYLAPQSCPPQQNARTSWVSNGRDNAFLVAGEKVRTGPGDSTPTCQADYNNDGNVTVQDVFDFLNTWFAGCN